MTEQDMDSFKSTISSLADKQARDLSELQERAEQAEEKEVVKPDPLYNAMVEDDIIEEVVAEVEETLEEEVEEAVAEAMAEEEIEETDEEEEVFAPESLVEKFEPEEAVEVHEDYFDKKFAELPGHNSSTRHVLNARAIRPESVETKENKLNIEGGSKGTTSRTGIYVPRKNEAVNQHKPRFAK